MTSGERAILDHLGRLASELGPMLAPAGHEELLQAIADTARSMFSAGACSLALLDSDQGELVFHVAAGGGDVVGTRVPVGEGIAGWVVTSGQPMVVEDVARDPRFARDIAAQTGYVPRSIMAMPLETEREMLGVIEILDAAEASGRNDLELLGLFARQAALAIESKTVFGQLGHALFAAAAHASTEGDIAAELERHARAAPGPSAELARLASDVSELARLGSPERAVAINLVGAFLDYVRGRER